MSHFAKKASCALMVICILSTFLCTVASARSSAYLDGYSATTTAQSGGVISVSVDVNGVGRMDKIGATVINLYASTDGRTFYRVVHYTSDEHPEMMTTNSYDYYATPLSYNGVIGHYYYASVYVYAEKNGGSHERNYTTTTVRALP